MHYQLRMYNNIFVLSVHVDITNITCIILLINHVDHLLFWNHAVDHKSCVNICNIYLYNNCIKCNNLYHNTLIILTLLYNKL